MAFHIASLLTLTGNCRASALSRAADRLRRLARTVAGAMLAVAALVLLSQPAVAVVGPTLTVTAASNTLTVGGATTTLTAVYTGANQCGFVSGQDVSGASLLIGLSNGSVTVANNAAPPYLVVTPVSAGTDTITLTLNSDCTIFGSTNIAVVNRATTSYQYTGKPFNLFSCGDAPDCPIPAPGNVDTSYSTSNFVTATLTLSGPLSPNTTYTDLTSGDGVHLLQLTLSDGTQTLQPPFYSPTACVVTDGSGNITKWFLALDTEGNKRIYTSNDPGNLVCPGAHAVKDYGQSNNLVGFRNYGYNTALQGSFSPPYPTQSIAASLCTAPQTCNLTGGVLTFQIRGTPAALAIINGSNFTITDELCVVPKDPRGKNCGAQNQSDGDGEDQNPRPLKVSEVCPGFGKTVIPDYLCGASGPSGSGFALIRSVAEEVDSLNGILVDYLAEPGANPALQSPNNPKCPVNGVGDGVGALGYRTDSLVEEVTPEGPLLLEMTYACDEHKSAGPKTIQSAGLKLHLNNSEKFDGDTRRDRLVSFANYKYRNLKTVVNDIPSNSSTQALARCINFSQGFLNNGNPSGPACAAEQAWQCDAFVELHAGDFQQSFSPLRLPDPYGDIRRRLGNLYYTEFVRISRQPPPTDWRPADPGICTPLPFQTGG